MFFLNTLVSNYTQEEYMHKYFVFSVYILKRHSLHTTFCAIKHNICDTRRIRTDHDILNKWCMWIINCISGEFKCLMVYVLYIMFYIVLFYNIFSGCYKFTPQNDTQRLFYGFLFLVKFK